MNDFHPEGPMDTGVAPDMDHDFLRKTLSLFYSFIVQYAPLLGYGQTSKQPSAAGTSIRFLKALRDAQYEMEVKDKIVELANFILSIQCTDPSKNWYGGVPTEQGGSFYYAIDAAFAGEALLDAYDISQNSYYLTGAQLCASFLRHMQTRNLVGLVDQYYGGFCEYQRSDNGAYLTEMFTKLLLSLPFLKRLYGLTQNSLYITMAQDARSFLGNNGLAGEYEYYNPKPYGDNVWHREPPSESVVFADSMAYALRGVYEYEGLSNLVKTVYSFFQGFSGYDPRFAWAGYLDVINKTYYSNYYDTVVGGILSEIRANYDPNNLLFQHNETIGLGPDAFYWGLDFTYNPINGSYQNTTTVAGMGWGIAVTAAKPKKWDPMSYKEIRLGLPGGIFYGDLEHPLEILKVCPVCQYHSSQKPILVQLI
jgi:hypothetical protein